MKKILLAVLAVFAAACGSTGTKQNLKEMKITVNNSYGNPVVTWEKPEGEELHYEVLIRTVSSSDGGKTGMMMYNVPVDYETFHAGDYIAYYAQEHEYYGPLSFQVTAYDKETAVAQGTSDIILAADCFPSVKELVFGEDVKPEDITMISYSGTGSMAGDNFHYTLYKEDDEYLLDAAFFDETGEHTAEHPVDAEVYEQAKAFLEGGRIVRKTVGDPEIILLDGGEEGYELYWNGMSELQRSWYEFIPAHEQEWSFRQFLTDISLE